MKMTNRGNRVIYRLWAPVYDALLHRLFMPGRRRALEVLGVGFAGFHALQPGQWVLLPGVGTGADLPWLPEGTKAVGTTVP